MGDLIVRAPQTTTVAPDTAAAVVPTQQPRTIGRRILDLVDVRQRNYVVFGDKAPPNLRQPGSAGYNLRGVSPTGERWVTARLTNAEAHALKQRGFRVVEDVEFQAPDPTPVPADVVEPDNVFARDIHQVRELNAIGPAFEGERGLFISVDTGVARHRDLPDALHFDNVLTEAPEDPQADNRTHGTHTTGSAIAHGDPDTGGTRGMAPRAQLAGVAVLGTDGRGSLATILRGIERAVEFARLHPDKFVVVNMSLGASARNTPENDPMVQAIERATREHGILFTISAGNRGPSLGTVGTPGIAPSALTFGAMDHRNTPTTADDVVARFSSRDREGGTKPNLVARGVGVRSTLPNNAYGNMSGTSMATPIGGGAALALGSGLLDMFERGELRVDPRELVKTGQFQAIIAEAALDNPNVPSNHEGSGDLRIMNAYHMFIQRFGTANTAGPAPYIPRNRLPPPPESLRYTPPF